MFHGHPTVGALEFQERHMSDEEEIDLSALNDEDLTAQMHDDLYDGLADEITEGTNILLARG
jgi:5-methyltetrahydrofolate--homocysteine methyltransferase